MVIGRNGKRFSIRALEFRVISATIRLQQMKSVYRVYLVQPRQRLPPKPGHFLNVIWIRFSENDNQINQRSDTEQAERQKIQNSASNLALIKTVRSDETEKQAKKKCDPFILFLPRRVNGIIDDNRLSGGSRCGVSRRSSRRGK